MCAIQRSSSGSPRMPTRQLRPANLSSAGRAKRLAISSWSAASTLIAKCPLRISPSRLSARWYAQKSTNGGSSDTEVKEFAVRPYRTPSASQLVTTVTPVVKTPTACLKSQLSSCPARNRDGPAMASPGEQLPSRQHSSRSLPTLGPGTTPGKPSVSQHHCPNGNRTLPAQQTSRGPQRARPACPSGKAFSRPDGYVVPGAQHVSVKERRR